jgi:hypothetical protein
MKKAILTLYDEKFADLAKLSLPSIKRCAKLNKAELCVETKSFDESRPIPWSKVLMCESALEDYDVVFWFDIDSIFTGDDNDIFRLSTKPIVINRPVTTFGSAKFNTGHMFLQQHSDTFKFLKETYEQTDFIYNNWYENAAMLELYDKFKDSIALKSFFRLVDLTIPPKYAIDSPYLGVHYPGGSVDQIKVAMKFDLLRSKYE